MSAMPSKNIRSSQKSLASNPALSNPGLPRLLKSSSGVDGFEGFIVGPVPTESIEKSPEKTRLAKSSSNLLTTVPKPRKTSQPKIQLAPIRFKNDAPVLDNGKSRDVVYAESRKRANELSKQFRTKDTSPKLEIKEEEVPKVDVMQRINERMAIETEMEKKSKAIRSGFANFLLPDEEDEKSGEVGYSSALIGLMNTHEMDEAKERPNWPNPILMYGTHKNNREHPQNYSSPEPAVATLTDLPSNRSVNYDRLQSTVKVPLTTLVPIGKMRSSASSITYL